MKSDSMDMCSGPILKKIILYTLPIIATGILQLLFNAADLVVVGQFCGSIYVAAVGSTGSLINLITNLFMGLSIGAGASVAHAIGAKDDEETHKIIHTALPIAAICGVILTFVGVFGAHRLLKLMSTPDNVLALSSTYLKIYFLGITATLIYNFGAAILRAAGDTRGPLIYLTISGVVNIVLNIFFVTVFHMNVAGVALATAISQTVSAVLIIIALMRRTDGCRLELSKLRFYKREILKILRIGVPAGIQSSLFSLSNVIIQSSINSFGDIAMSGSAAAGNIEGFVWVAINSFSHTSLNFVSQNVGAKNYGRVRRIVWTCLGCVTVTGLVFGTVVNIFARPLLGIYITDSPTAIEYGAVRLAFICLPYFICGLMDTATGAIRGLGSSVAPMIVTVGGVCGFRILWIYTVFRIPEYHSLESLWISYAISWAITFLVELAVFFILYKKKTRVPNRAEPAAA